MLGKMSVGVRSAASTPKDRNEEGEDDKSVRSPESDLNDPHVRQLLLATVAPAGPRVVSPSIMYTIGRSVVNRSYVKLDVETSAAD